MTPHRITAETLHNGGVVGETLSRYHLVAHLGSGAMGDVYRAEDERLLRTVALKVVDFGVARWSAPIVDATPTQTVDPLQGTAAGTLSYMSPEQTTGRPLDGRSDMFSLGVVIYELLSGRRLFDGPNAAQVLEAL